MDNATLQSGDFIFNQMEHNLINIYKENMSEGSSQEGNISWE